MANYNFFYIRDTALSGKSNIYKIFFCFINWKMNNIF